MSKTLSFEYEGKKYTLEYTRSSVAKMERDGFKASDLEDYPLSTLPELFKGAFIAHHPSVGAKTIDDIFIHLGDKGALLEALADMYMEPIETLMGDPAEGKVEWVKSF